MSARPGQLSEDNLRELARIIRGIHARAAAKRERLRREAGLPPLPSSEDAPHSGPART